MTGIVEDIDDH